MDTKELIDRYMLLEEALSDDELVSITRLSEEISSGIVGSQRIALRLVTDQDIQEHQRLCIELSRKLDVPTHFLVIFALPVLRGMAGTSEGTWMMH